MNALFAKQLQAMAHFEKVIAELLNLEQRLMQRVIPFYTQQIDTSNVRMMMPTRRLTFCRNKRTIKKAN